MFVYNQVQPITTSRKHVMLQRHRPVVGVYDMAGLFVQVAYPFGELSRVRNGRREEHVSHIVRKKDDSFLPNDSSF